MNKTVTIDEFDKAVVEAAAKITIEHMDMLQATMLFATSGMTFAAEVRRILFGENAEDKKEQED